MWGWLVGGGGEPQSGGENIHCVVTLVLWIDPLVVKMAQK